MNRNEHGQMNVWFYDLILWTFSIIVDLFFREVHPRSSWKIPRTGPVIFVAAPHANQFVDPLILMRTLRMEAHRRVAFLIAEKSTKRRFIGWFARSVGAVTVGRALDSTKPASGRIYLPDPENDPTLVRGVDTNFEAKDFQVGGLLVLPSVNNEAANSEIAEIVGPEELRLKKPFKGAVAWKQLTGKDSDEQRKEQMNGDTEKQIEESKDYQGTKFKIAPKVDQSKVYDAVFDRLNRGGCVGIFPEGGSHDRTELLPLKAGVAIMALGAVAANPECGVTIVPCGMNYFHAHKFRSRAVVEFGTPVEVPPELVDEYKNGSRRDAVGRMLEIVYNALVAVTVTSPDYETLMLIQAVRRLYNPKGKKLPLPMVVELNRRLMKGYNHYKDDPRILRLSKNVNNYHKALMRLNVRDHQLDYAKFSVIEVVAKILYRLIKLLILSAAVLPGLILFAPVFIAGKVISVKKAKEALAASTVKIQARDVIATWKLLVSLALAPTLYTFYTIILTIWTYYNRIQDYVPDFVRLWQVVVFGYIFFPAITFAALRFGETGMDIVKSLRPLALCLSPSSGNTIVKLRQQREELSREVTDLINELGPEIFPDFDANRIVKLAEEREQQESQARGRDWSEIFYIKSRESSPDQDRRGVSIGGGSSFAGYLPRNESFKNLSNFGFFATRPQTPTSPRSRRDSHNNLSRPSSSGKGAALGSMNLGFSPIDSKDAMNDVSKKIRGAMRERGQRRTSEGDDAVDSDESASEDNTTPNEDGVTLKKTV